MTVPFETFLTVWAFLGLNVLSPGPNVFNTLTTAMGSGRRAGLFSAYAVGLGVSIWAVAMVTGAAALFTALPLAQSLLTALGAILLILFGLRYLAVAQAGLRDRARLPQPRTGMAPRPAFLRSLAVNALNPKALTTWLVILTIFPVAEAGIADLAVLAAGSALLAMLIHAFYALLFSTGRALRFYVRAAPWVNACVGLFFIGIAASLLYELAFA